MANHDRRDKKHKKDLKREQMKKEQRASAAKAAAIGRLDRHVLDLAKAWSKEPDGCPEPLLDDPGFDDALERQAERLCRIVGGDLVGFNAFLRREAEQWLTGCVAEDGTKLLLSADLFFVPIHGPVDQIEAFLDDDDLYDSFARSFKRSGMAHEDSTVYVPRLLLGSEDVLLATPGALRGMLREMVGSMVPFNPARFAGSDARIGRAIGVDPEERVGPDAGGAVIMGERALAGVRIHFVGAGEDIPTDYLTEFLPPTLLSGIDFDEDDNFEAEDPSIQVGIDVDAGGYAGDEEDGDDEVDESEEDGDFVEIDLWRGIVEEETGDLLLVFDLPMSINDAVHTMARNRVEGFFSIERILRGIDEEKKADRAHVHIGDEVVVELDFEGVHIGPISVPASMLLYGDPDEFLDGFIKGIAGEVLLHDTVATMPHARAKRM